MQTDATRMKTRLATEDDAPLVREYLQKLALYEKRPADMTATEEDIRRELFQNHRSEVLIAELDGETIGFALFCLSLASFKGKCDLYLDDLFVDPAYRGKGLGKELLRRVALRARELGCERMRWGCMRWNEPSIRFYDSLGAEQDDSHITFVLHKPAMETLLASPE